MHGNINHQSTNTARAKDVQSVYVTQRLINYRRTTTLLTQPVSVLRNTPYVFGNDLQIRNFSPTCLSLSPSLSKQLVPAFSVELENPMMPWVLHHHGDERFASVCSEPAPTAAPDPPWGPENRPTGSRESNRCPPGTDCSGRQQLPRGLCRNPEEILLPKSEISAPQHRSSLRCPPTVWGFVFKKHSFKFRPAQRGYTGAIRQPPSCGPGGRLCQSSARARAACPPALNGGPKRPPAAAPRSRARSDPPPRGARRREPPAPAPPPLTACPAPPSCPGRCRRQVEPPTVPRPQIPHGRAASSVAPEPPAAPRGAPAPEGKQRAGGEHRRRG